MSFRPTLAAALLVPCLAVAAELGRLTVLSGVGEPLRAEIEIVALRPGEAAALGARIPPPDVFWRANLEPAPVLDELRVGVERRAQGRYVIAVRSSGPIADPFIQLLVELTSPAGGIVREYPFLLEEPRARRPRADTPPPGSPPIEVSLPVAPPGDGYVVKAGDTLAVIAERLRSPGVTLEQMIVALYQANEPAFFDRNMNWLRASEALAVPAEAAVRAIEPAAARRIILEHRAAFDEYRKRLAGVAAVGPVTAGARAPGETPPLATSSRAVGDRLQLSRGNERKPGGAAAGTAREDDLAALRHALGETQERIALLEKNIDDVRRLLAVKKERIALLEKDVKPLVLKNHELASMQHEGPMAVETLEPALGGADASRAGPDGKWPLEHFLRDHGRWLLVAFLLGFLSWIVMPLKTLRLWVRKHRRRVRRARKATERVRRAARDAGLLPSSA